MNLAVRAALSRIDKAAEDTGFTNYRTDYKLNAKGELVIALIIPPPRTDPEQWRVAWASSHPSGRKR